MANSVVGTLTVDGVTINILPKAGVGKTTIMLAYSLGLARWLPERSLFDESAPLTELLVTPFIAEVKQLLAQGLGEDYVETGESGPHPRGRINFQGLVRRGLPLPVDYTFDDFTIDTAWNQLLKRALLGVRDLPALSAASHAAARDLLNAFAGVRFEEAPPLYAPFQYLSERFRHYKPALILASLILQGLGLEATAAQQHGRGLLFDMNRVFEAFVTALIDHVRPRDLSLDVQGYERPLYLDAERRHRLHPDFSLWSGANCHLMGDVKYKILDETKGPRRGDLYQMVSYAASAKTDRALLLYVGDHPDTTIRVPSPEVSIGVAALDLSWSVPMLERRLAQIIAD